MLQQKNNAAKVNASELNKKTKGPLLIQIYFDSKGLLTTTKDPVVIEVQDPEFAINTLDDVLMNNKMNNLQVKNVSTE